MISYAEHHKASQGGLGEHDMQPAAKKLLASCRLTGNLTLFV